MTLSVGRVSKFIWDRFPSPQHIHWLQAFPSCPNFLFYHDVTATALNTKKRIPWMFPTRCLLRGACPRRNLGHARGGFMIFLSGQSPLPLGQTGLHYSPAPRSLPDGRGHVLITVEGKLVSTCLIVFWFKERSAVTLKNEKFVRCSSSHL
jgi:hypothetical protein